jgi:hypothetical protein
MKFLSDSRSSRPRMGDLSIKVCLRCLDFIELGIIPEKGGVEWCPSLPRSSGGVTSHVVRAVSLLHNIGLSNQDSTRPGFWRESFS